MKITEIISSSDFDSWFAGSKLTNPDGSPMMMYHGTKSSEIVFDTQGSGERGQMLGPGIYLSNSPEYASKFGKVIPFYGKAEHLMREGDPGVVAAWNKHRRGYWEKFLGQYARAHGYDGIVGNLGVWGGKPAFQVVLFSPEQVRPAG